MLKLILNSIHHFSPSNLKSFTKSLNEKELTFYKLYSTSDFNKEKFISQYFSNNKNSFFQFKARLNKKVVSFLFNFIPKGRGQYADYYSLNKLIFIATIFHNVHIFSISLYFWKKSLSLALKTNDSQYVITSSRYLLRYYSSQSPSHSKSLHYSNLIKKHVAILNDEIQSELSYTDIIRTLISPNANLSFESTSSTYSRLSSNLDHNSSSKTILYTYLIGYITYSSSFKFEKALQIVEQGHVHFILSHPSLSDMFFNLMIECYFNLGSEQTLSRINAKLNTTSNFFIITRLIETKIYFFIQKNNFSAAFDLHNTFLSENFSHLIPRAVKRFTILDAYLKLFYSICPSSFPASLDKNNFNTFASLRILHESDYSVSFLSCNTIICLQYFAKKEMTKFKSCLNIINRTYKSIEYNNHTEMIRFDYFLKILNLYYLYNINSLEFRSKIKPYLSALHDIPYKFNIQYEYPLEILNFSKLLNFIFPKTKISEMVL